MTGLPFPKNAVYLSVKEVAALFRKHPKNICRWIDKGDLPAIKLGRDWRIKVSDLKAFAAARQSGGLEHVL